MPGSQLGKLEGKILQVFRVPEGPIPLIGVNKPCWIPPLQDPQYGVSKFTIGTLLKIVCQNDRLNQDD